MDQTIYIIAAGSNVACQILAENLIAHLESLVLDISSFETSYFQAT